MIVNSIRKEVQMQKQTNRCRLVSHTVSLIEIANHAVPLVWQRPW